MNRNNESNFNDPLVSIIILNYNGHDYIFDCLESVFKIQSNFEVILIDNNSSDHSQDECTKKYPKIRFFQNQKNLAMSARNIGIDNAKGDFILFLDADTVVNPDLVTILLESFRENGPGLYQGKEVAKQNPSNLESAGNMTNIFGFGFARGRGKPDNKQYEKFETISFPVGGFTFSSTEIIKKIGYIDELHLFFLMLDDVEYGWRSWLLDIPCYYEPKAVILHLGSPVLKWSKRKFFYAEKNRWVCILSLYSTTTLLKLFPILILIDFGSFIFLLSKGLGLAKIKSFFSLLKLLPKILLHRKKIQKTRKVNDKKIIENFVDHVELPSMSLKSNSVFNSTLISFSKFARKLI